MAVTARAVLLMFPPKPVPREEVRLPSATNAMLTFSLLHLGQIIFNCPIQFEPRSGICGFDGIILLSRPMKWNTGF